MKKQLLIIQPIFSKYRVPVWGGLSEFYNVHILYSDMSEVHGFGKITNHDKSYFSSITLSKTIFIGKKFFYQKKIFSTINKIKPDKILVCGATKDLSFWLLLLYSKVKSLKLYIHTQGPFNKSNRSIFYKILYKTIIFFSYRIILYSRYSKKKLESFKIFSKKIFYVNNTLVLPYSQINENTIKFNPDKLKLLFIGRIRHGVGLEKLLFYIKNSKYIEINIIGEGINSKYLKKKFKSENIIWHGSIYDNSVIHNISNKCHFGIYPGNAGLSVVHYLSLNLPVIIHDNLCLHQGPEPSYIIDKFNGFKFKDSDDKSNLFKMLINIYNNLSNEDYHKMQSNANKTFYDLSFPSYSQKLFKIIDE